MAAPDLCRLAHWSSTVLLGATLFCGGHALAEEPAPPQLQFYFTPYLWVSGITGTTSTSNPNAPSQTTSASFGDILSHLNSIPIMGAFETRYGRFGLSTDLIGVSLKSDISTQGLAFSGGTATVSELLSTIMPTYRVFERPDQYLDLGVGVRIIAYWTKLSFNTGLLPGFSRSPSLEAVMNRLPVKRHV